MAFWDEIVNAAKPGGKVTAPKSIYDMGYKSMNEYFDALANGRAQVWQQTGGGEAGGAEEGYRSHVADGSNTYMSRPGGNIPGEDKAYFFDNDGNYLRSEVTPEKDGNSLLLGALAAAGGMAFGLPALMGSQAGAGGAAALGAAGEGAVGGGIAGAAGDAGLMYAGAGAEAAASLGAAPSLAGTGAATASPGLMQQITQKLGAGPVSKLLEGGMSLETLADLAGIAAPIIGGVVSGKAAGDAADAQLQAAREAQALSEPFRQGGLLGLNRLLEQLGLGPNTTAPGYGSAVKKFGMEDFQADPGYQFRLAEGEKALQRAAAAQGRIGSGKFFKDAVAYNQGMASDEYGRSYDRYGTDIARRINPLQSLSGAGQTAANTVGGYATQAGNAQAAGAVGQANALNTAIGQGFSMYQNNQQANQNRLFQNAMMDRWARQP